MGEDTGQWLIGHQWAVRNQDAFLADWAGQKIRREDFEMTLKDIWVRAGNWLMAQKPAMAADYHPEIDDEGLISPQLESESGPVQPADQGTAEGNEVVVKPVPPAEKIQSLEKMQAGFDQLIEQLRGINEHLNRQVSQHEQLMGRVDQVPKFLESFPAVVENQKQVIEQLLEQVKAAAAKQEQFADIVEKIPTETAKQTDALVNIDHQLSAAADTDVQMAESFNKFHETLERLDQSTISQTDGIMEMSKTFATSDRYLKYIISRQNKRFMWMFIAAIGVCVLVIVILTGIIIYLRQFGSPG